MEIDRCTKEDFDQILTEIVDFWGSDRTLPFHHPMFLYEFGETAFVIREGGKVVAYLFGLIVERPGGERLAYAHLLGVRRPYRRHGLARRLYSHFVHIAAAHNCRRLKAITTAGNEESIRFHTALGMEMLGTPNAEGVPVVSDYSGPGGDRVVFSMRISASTSLGS